MVRPFEDHHYLDAGVPKFGRLIIPCSIHILRRSIIQKRFFESSRLVVVDAHAGRLSKQKKIGVITNLVAKSSSKIVLWWKNSADKSLVCATPDSPRSISTGGTIFNHAWLFPRGGYTINCYHRAFACTRSSISSIRTTSLRRARLQSCFSLLTHNIPSRSRPCNFAGGPATLILCTERPQSDWRRFSHYQKQHCLSFVTHSSVRHECACWCSSISSWTPTTVVAPQGGDVASIAPHRASFDINDMFGSSMPISSTPSSSAFGGGAMYAPQTRQMLRST